MKGFCSLSKHSPFFLFPHIPDSRLSYYVELSSFFATQGRFFLRLELSRGTTIAAEIGQTVVDLKLEVK